jgi:MYXO-CTERM domain-containing protein
VPILQNGVTPANVFPCFDIPSVPDVLPSGVDWKFYGSNFDGFFSDIWSPFDAINGIRNDAAKWGHVVGTAEFTSDVTNHVLPAVTWLVDQDQYSEHPHLVLPGVNVPLGGVCDGEGWTVGFINQIMQSEYWQDTAILFTMDDYGGWHDHVPPPRQYGGTATAPYGLGFRLPLLLISPYAKPGFIFKEVSEQASIASFIEAIFHSTTTLSSLDSAAQDGQANNLLNAFDFNQTPLPPLVLQPHSCTNANDSLGGATGTPSGPAPAPGGAGGATTSGTGGSTGGTGSAGHGGSTGGTGSAGHGGSVGIGDAGANALGDGGAIAVGDAGATSDMNGGTSSGGTSGALATAGSFSASGGSGNGDGAGSAALSNAGANDGTASSSHDSGGCGCSTVGSQSSVPRSAGSLGLAALAWVALRRRRRK